MKLKAKRISALLLSFVLLCSVLGVSAAAAPKAGVYTAHVTTSYYNPDTGEVDDGGSANAALGEGMCRSAVAETCLVEVDKNGDTWVTLRFLLQSNCKNVAIYKRTGNNTYSQLGYDIMAEDSAADSIDYRIKVPSAGVKLKGTMYVTPMGRDVLWYLWVDTGTMKEGSGDFVVSIDTSAPEPKPEPKPQPKPQPKPDPKPAVKPETETAKPAAAPADTAEKDDAAAQPKPGDAEAVPGENDPENAETADAEEPSEAGAFGEAAEQDAAADAAEAEDPADAEAEENDAEQGGISAGMIAGILAALVVVIGAAVLLMKKKK